MDTIQARDLQADLLQREARMRQAEAENLKKMIADGEFHRELDVHDLKGHYPRREDYRIRVDTESSIPVPESIKKNSFLKK